MIYDGHDLSHILKVESIERGLLPGVSVSSAEVGGADGSAFGSASFDALEITVRGRFFAPVSGTIQRRAAIESKRRELAGILGKRGLCKLVLDDAPDVWRWAVLTGETPLEVSTHAAGVSLTFLCPDPVAYGAKRTKRKPAGGKMLLDVGGNSPAAPVVSFESAGGPSVLKFDGVPFKVMGTSMGSTIAVDAAEHVATADGAPVAVAIESDYPELAPGRHEIECAQPFKVEWTERWL